MEYHHACGWSGTTLEDGNCPQCGDESPWKYCYFCGLQDCNCKGYEHMVEDETTYCAACGKLDCDGECFDGR